jgi:hypothetical protein
MTEVEWLGEEHHCQELVWMVQKAGAARTKAGRRRLRLFAVACCRLVWDLLADPRLRHAVEVAERFAEGRAGKRELEAAHLAAKGLRVGSFVPGDPLAVENTAANMAAWAAHPRPFAAAFDMTVYPLPLAGRSVGGREGAAALRGVLRCVFPDPTRPLPFDRARLTPTVVSLAQAANDERVLPGGELDPQRLAVLADALEEAGAAADLAGHLRGPGPHVRGCHVIDAILENA